MHVAMRNLTLSMAATVFFCITQPRFHRTNFDTKKGLL
jgi:hypothetical protein